MGTKSSKAKASACPARTRTSATSVAAAAQKHDNDATSVATKQQGVLYAPPIAPKPNPHIAATNMVTLLTSSDRMEHQHIGNATIAIFNEVPATWCNALIEDVWSWTTESQRATSGILLPSRYDPLCHSVAKWIEPYARTHCGLLSPRMRTVSSTMTSDDDQKLVSIPQRLVMDMKKWQLSLTSGYIVRYKPAEHASIPPHYDTNHVTFNLCLGRKFKGGALRIHGHHHRGYKEFNQKIGKAFIHSGDVLHSTCQVWEGERINLVVKFNWMPVDTSNAPFHCWNQLFDNGQRAILQYCTTGDLSSLAQCNHQSHTRVREGVIWRHVYSCHTELCQWLPIQRLEQERRVTLIQESASLSPYTCEIILTSQHDWYDVYRTSVHHWSIVIAMRDFIARPSEPLRRRVPTFVYFAHNTLTNLPEFDAANAATDSP